MAIFLWIVSVCWIIMGMVLILSPLTLKRYVEIICKIPKTLFGLIVLVVGLLFLWASPVSSWSWFIAILGMLVLLKGLFILLSPIGLVRATISWWMNQTPSLYRFWGVIIIVLAVLIICSIV